MSVLWFLSGLRTPALTAIFRMFTYFGEQYVAIALLCVLYWCVNKQLARGMALSFFASALVIQWLKILLQIDRPWILDPAFEPVEAALAAATGYSFPSGHTQAAAAIFGYLGLSTRKPKWIILSWLLVLMVGLSRLYLGVHTPADVIASVVIALAGILLVQWALRNPRREDILLLCLTAASILVLVHATLYQARGTVETHYLADCCKAAGGCIGCTIGLYWVRRRIPFDTATPAPWQQPVKLIIGIATLLLIQNGTKPLFPSHILFDALRYGLIALWALALYPLIFTRLLNRRSAA